MRIRHGHRDGGLGTAVFALAIAVVLVPSVTSGCGSSQDAGLQPSGSGTATQEKNPYGAIYPTTNQGTHARTAATPGNVIKNYRFQGYPTDSGKAVDMSQGLKTVQLADYFDPDQKLLGDRGIKVIHLSVAAVWCDPCNAETNDSVAAAADLVPQGVVFLQALDDGPVEGRGATKDDLDGWITSHKINFTEMLDPGLKNFGTFFDAAAVPWNANVDARSMEILEAGVGSPAEGIKENALRWVRWVDGNPPAYKPGT